MNLFILDKEYNKIGILSNQGASPIAPFFDDKYTQELNTGADTYEFSTIYTYQTQELMEIGNHIIFEFNNEHKLFVIVDVEFSHKNGMNTINVYAEGIGFELLEKYIDKFETEGNFNNLLGIILVGTGWEHEVNSKLTAIRKMKYDGEKNLLAIIQDAIKTYDGAEVKFEVDYSSNKIKKKVRVYENGGRGSHIGYRFEYGKNVNGVTKKEEIANSKDDTVHYTNDNDIGILLEYNIDVAMRSEEIAQFDIGDTHYVIDHDFTPPLLIEARIGKIEISFSDPTKNKLYLANYKNATGAISQKTHKDDVAGIAQNIINSTPSDVVAPHDHYELTNSIFPNVKVGFYGNYFMCNAKEEISDPGEAEYNLGNFTYPWNLLYVNTIHCFGTIRALNGLSSPSVLVDELVFTDGTKMTTASSSGSTEGSTGLPSTIDNLQVNKVLSVGSSTAINGSAKITIETTWGKTTIQPSGINTDGGITCKGKILAEGGLTVKDGTDFAAGNAEVDTLVAFNKVILPNGDQITPGTPSITGSSYAISELSEDTTVEELQQKIASLEARLAKIEAMLGIDNE